MKSNLSIITEQSARIQQMEAELTALREENERLVKWVDDLLCILRTLLWATGQGSVSVGEKRNKINAPH